MDELGAKLEALRKKSKKSLALIKSETGITDSRLRRIEKSLNDSGPSFETLKLLAKCYNANLVDLYLAAGYLDKESLNAYQQVFSNTELLRDEEKEIIQKQIDLFVERREKNGV